MAICVWLFLFACLFIYLFKNARGSHLKDASHIKIIVQRNRLD
ncbi:hypothetical protein HMPREF1580_00137 [Gardnerella vaginalis JCP8070]|nr:hypothetical protein HMPREF1586_00023 [Gardnerella vaginalis JCP8522]EPI45490.1 hypothetical protein HMPREF1583_01241 [Gardnerella vaginalis JCP8151B]EPI48365.1 hypothetical protein HMPREF1582_00327 [Gardnerella vaginalis JCP8151A]EPI59456.1 hypothetical protein HMPREF1579_00919 [Gardnerella vaginalis JCP8066]EPI61024.1 hypothetical protein HMPREF1580_00137 [Gardnerella vaginalis JCP8070]